MLLLGVLQAQAAGGAVGAGSFDLLETQVLDSAESSVTFSSLSTYAADYQHLQLRAVNRSSTAGATADTVALRFNSDSGSNYSRHRLIGIDGSSVSSGGAANQTEIRLGGANAASSPSNAFGVQVVDILDFASSSKNTTIRSSAGLTSRDLIYLNSGAYFQTSAITSINIFLTSSNNFVTGSRFSLYGIRGS